MAVASRITGANPPLTCEGLTLSITQKAIGETVAIPPATAESEGRAYLKTRLRCL